MIVVGRAQGATTSKKPARAKAGTRNQAPASPQPRLSLADKLDRSGDLLAKQPQQAASSDPPSSKKQQTLILAATPTRAAATKTSPNQQGRISFGAWMPSPTAQQSPAAAQTVTEDEELQATAEQPADSAVCRSLTFGNTAQPGAPLEEASDATEPMESAGAEDSHAQHPSSLPQPSPAAAAVRRQSSGSSDGAMSLAGPADSSCEPQVADSEVPQAASSQLSDSTPGQDTGSEAGDTTAEPHEAELVMGEARFTPAKARADLDASNLIQVRTTRSRPAACLPDCRQTYSCRQAPELWIYGPQLCQRAAGKSAAAYQMQGPKDFAKHMQEPSLGCSKRHAAQQECTSHT